MDRERSYELLGVSAAFLLGLLVRLVPARNALVDGEIVFYGYDSFYHLRRILYTTENFPSTLWFDSYLNHPFGLELTWPPLFDQMIAAASLILGGSPRAAEIAGAIIPPILGSVAIILLYLLAKKLFGMEVALLSAFIMAIDPKHITRTHSGWLDHDVMESLLILAAILLLVYALTERDRWAKFAIAAGILIAATAYTWLGTPAYMGVILISSVFLIALDLKNGNPSGETVFPLAAAFGVALALILPFWDNAWLKPSFFGALASLLGLLFLYLLSRLFAAKRILWQAFVPAVAIFGYLGLVLSYMFTPNWGGHPLWRGLSYFFGGGLASVGIMEASPVYRYFDLVSLPSLGLAFSLLGLGVLIQLTLRSGLPKVRVLFLIWVVFSLILPFFQIRFLFLFSLTGSVLISLLFFWAAERLRSSGLKDPSMVKALSLALLVILLLPNVAGVKEIAEEKLDISEDWIETLDWVKENTPKTEGFENPGRAGDYGIMSWWDYGNWILYQSRRPVVANNFQAGAEDSARFFLAESEEESLKTIDKRDSRYVITDDKMAYTKLPAIARWINEEPGSYVQIAEDRDTVTYHHSQRFMRTTLAKLHLLDCTNLGHFRLIYESETFKGTLIPVKEVKVFEKVPGAKIAGTTPYDEPMGAILEMTSNQGRHFQYYNSAMPVDGRYEITVPYPTEDAYGTHSVGLYLIGSLKNVAGGEAKEVEVSEEDILQGRVVEVNF